MQKIRNRILRMREGSEKKFLLDIAVKVEQAIKANDLQKMERLNGRLNGLFDGLSAEGQAVAKEISKKIMEAHNA